MHYSANSGGNKAYEVHDSDNKKDRNIMELTKSPLGLKGSMNVLFHIYTMHSG